MSHDQLTFHRTSFHVSFWRSVPWAEMVENRVWLALFLTAALSSTHRSERCLREEEGEDEGDEKQWEGKR